MIPLPPEPSAGYPILDWAKLVMAFLRRVRPIVGPGLRLIEGTHGFTITTVPGSQNSSDEKIPTPFQGISSGVNLGINPLSTVFKNLKGEKIPITGLLYDPTDPTDPGWFPCPNRGEKIWLQIGTADPAHPTAGPQLWPATTTIKYGEPGGSLWEEYPDPISVNRDDPANPFQEFYNLLLAEITDPETDPRPAILTVTIGTGDEAESRQITQCWNTHVLMPFLVVINGLLCLVPLSPPSQAP